MKEIVIAYSASKAISYEYSLALQWFPILMLFLATVLFSSGVFANDVRYKKSWDSICGIGESISAGCDIIRERKIMVSKAMPWRAIGQVNYSGYQHSQHCPGTLIGPKHLITAAYCVFDQKRKRWIAPGAINFLAGYGKSEYIAASKG